MKIYVSRPINGIPVNGMEFLLSDLGGHMEFTSVDLATKYLREHGCSDKMIEKEITFTYEVESVEEAERIIHDTADSAKDWMLEKRPISFGDYDEWAGTIQAAQDYLTQF